MNQKTAPSSTGPLDLMVGRLDMPSMNGKEVAPEIYLIGEPVVRPDLGPNKMACLASTPYGLALVELSIRLLPLN